MYVNGEVIIQIIMFRAASVVGHLQFVLVCLFIAQMFEGEWLNDTKCNGHGRDVYNTGWKKSHYPLLLLINT